MAFSVLSFTAECPTPGATLVFVTWATLPAQSSFSSFSTEAFRSKLMEWDNGSKCFPVTN
jgi:hypothetical protein